MVLRLMLRKSYRLMKRYTNRICEKKFHKLVMSKRRIAFLRYTFRMCVLEKIFQVLKKEVQYPFILNLNENELWRLKEQGSQWEGNKYAGFLFQGETNFKLLSRQHKRKTSLCWRDSRTCIYHEYFFKLEDDKTLNFLCCDCLRLPETADIRKGSPF